MPRVRSQTKPEASSRPQDKFKQCLEALVADPEAACLGGNEFCCTGCGGNSALVDSLCAFCLHSDAARQFFADNGGLEALFLAAATHNTEKGVLAALQILQCLCSTSHGQKLVAGQPKLLQLVCDQALQRDEDREGVQHASLLMLQSWVQDGQQNPLVSWIERYAKLNHVTDDMDSHQSVDNKKTAVTGLQTISEEEQEVMDAGAEAESKDTATGSSGVPDRHLLLQIASASLQHPTLAIRKASAQLFAVCLQNLHQPSITESASTRVKQLVLEVTRVLSKEQQAVAGPQFVAHAGGPSIVVLDPATYLREQERIQHHKQTCQALLQLASEMAAMGGQLGKEILTSSGVLPCVLAIFDCAWQINTQQNNNHVPTPGYGGSHMNKELLPFSFIQDHQSREMALDSLLSIFKQSGTLAALGRCVFEASGPSGMNSREGCRTVCNDDTDAESAGLARLQQSIDQMLGQPSSSHVRAALTLIGHVRFDNAVRKANNTLQNATEQNKVEVSYAPAHVQWLQQLSDVFEAAWGLEYQGDDHQVPTDTIPGFKQVANTNNQDGVQSTSAYPSSGSNTEYLWPAAGLQTAGNGSAHNGITNEGLGGNGAQLKGHPVARIELGLGYRVLVQVLQAWKSLLGLGSATVNDVLSNTNYKQLAARALQHPKYVVASTAHKLLYPSKSRDQHASGNPSSFHHNTPDSSINWQVMQGFDSPAHMQAQHHIQKQLQQGGDAAGTTLPSSIYQSDLNGSMSGLSLAEQDAAMLMEPDVGQGGTRVLQPPSFLSHTSPNEELNDHDMQEFLSVFLNASEGGEVGFNSHDTTAQIVAQPPANLDDKTMHQDRSMTGQQTLTVFDPLQQSDLMVSGMFSEWDIDIDAKDRKTIEEALMLLPDLDNVARNTTGYMQPAELAGFDDLPMMRPGGLISPLMMFNM